MVKAEENDVDLIIGITLSILSAIFAGVSTLAIRKSAVMMERILPNFSDPLLESPRHNNHATYQDTDDIEISVTSYGSSFPEDHASTNNVEEEERVNANSHTRIEKKSKILLYCGTAGLSTLHPLFGVLGIAFASPSLLSPLGSLCLVTVVIFSGSFIGEKPLRIQMYAAGFIILGEVAIVIWGDHINPSYATVEDVLQSYGEPKFVGFAVAFDFWIVTLFFVMHGHGSLNLQRFAWAASSGSILGLQNFCKDFLMLLELVSISKDEHYPWLKFLFLFMAAACYITAVVIQVVCIKRYNAIYSASIVGASFVISAAIMSAFHYDTFSNIDSTLNFILYCFGLFMVVLGIVLINYTPVVVG